MDAKTGKALEGIEHLKQSIIDILTTPVNSRIMRRDYGSRLFELVDKPINRDLTLEIYAATAEALGKFEKRFKLEKVKIAEAKEGKMTLVLGTFKKVCQAAFLVQLNFQSIWKENIKLRHS